MMDSQTDQSSSDSDSSESGKKLKPYNIRSHVLKKGVDRVVELS